MGISFPSLICLGMICLFILKRKMCKEHEKTKRIKMLLYKFASVFLEDMRVIWCTLKVMVSIKQLWSCVNDSWFSYIIIFIWWKTCAFLQKLHTQHATLCHSWYYFIGTMWFGYHKEYMW